MQNIRLRASLGLRAGIAALMLTSASLVGLAAPAHAADPAVLYVRATPATCSDAGPGSADQPFCTVGAAAAVVTAGQTVDVGPGNFPERVTITASGTPEQPIVFRAGQTSTPALSGPNGGFVIAGQHDIRFERFRVAGTVGVPALDLRDSSAITFDGGIQMAETATAPAIQLTAVTASRLAPQYILGRPPVAVTMDAATSGVTVDGVDIQASSRHTGVGVRLDGKGNRLLNTQVTNYATGVVIGAQATGTVVVNNATVSGGLGHGIHNQGATGTAITNNTVVNHCSDGIRVDGASAGVSVQNNVVRNNGQAKSSNCEGAKGGDGVEIGLYDGAVVDTVVDYNLVFHATLPAPDVYALGGTRMSQADFRKATGQAAHDVESAIEERAIDAANSSAPGYLSTDRRGVARADDPGVPNTGAGKEPYADRGAYEVFRAPAVAAELTLDLVKRTVRVDASKSVPGAAPIQSYEFDFGDGTTVSQATPIASHPYAQAGEYTVTTRVTGTDGRTSTRTDRVSVLPVIRTVGLLSLQTLMYVRYFPDYYDVTQRRLNADALFDVVDAGSGQVALLTRASGRYMSAGRAAPENVNSWTTEAGAMERFTLIRNEDGSISLRSVAHGRYVGLAYPESTGLHAIRSTPTTLDRFHEVRSTDMARTLKAHANGMFVSAAEAGAKPLIANRAVADAWEQFDIVDLGDGQIAIFARANNRFVAAEGAGTLPLQAKRFAVSTWERFTLIRNSDGSVSFRAMVNNRYVAAERAGAEPLLAQRTAISTWEKFTLG